VTEVLKKSDHAIMQAKLDCTLALPLNYRYLMRGASKADCGYVKPIDGLVTAAIKNNKLHIRLLCNLKKSQVSTTLT
jgi:hypothetical protein